MKRSLSTVATPSESGTGLGQAGGVGNAVGYFSHRFLSAWLGPRALQRARMYIWTLLTWTGPEEEVAFLQTSLYFFL